MPTGTCLYPDHHDTEPGYVIAVIAGAAAGIGLLAWAAIAAWRFAAAHAVILGGCSAAAVAIIGGSVWLLHRKLTVVGWSDEADAAIERYLRAQGRLPEPEDEPETEQVPEPARPAPWPGLRLVAGGDDNAA